jgi:hypothetical protein
LFALFLYKGYRALVSLSGTLFAPNSSSRSSHLFRTAASWKFIGHIMLL